MVLLDVLIGMKPLDSLAGSSSVINFQIACHSLAHFVHTAGHMRIENSRCPNVLDKRDPTFKQLYRTLDISFSKTA